MNKSPEAFRTIGEAAQELGVPQHVLRFWETKFGHVRPMKRAGGRRYYRPADIELLKGVRGLLYDQGYTIKGVQKLFRDQGPKFVCEHGQSGESPLASIDVEGAPANGFHGPEDDNPSVAPASSPASERQPAVAVEPAAAQPAKLPPDEAVPGPGEGGLSAKTRERLSIVLERLQSAKARLNAAIDAAESGQGERG